MRWFATLFVVGCRFGDALPVPDSAALDTPADVGADASGSCAGYMAVGTHFYKLISSPDTWDIQRATCQATQGDLAFPEDAAQLAVLTSIAGQGRNYWIGIDDVMTEGTYLTVRNTLATFLPWTMGEPTGTTLEDCVRAQGATISDDRCNLKFVASCECVPKP